MLDAPVRGAPAGKFAGLIGGDPLWSKVKKCAESTLQWQSAIIGLSWSSVMVRPLPVLIAPVAAATSAGAKASAK